MKKLLLTIHLLIAAGLLLTGYASWLNPMSFGLVALAGYAFPLMLLLTVGSIALAVFTRKRHLVVPFVALLLAYSPVTLYTPYHREQTVPDGALSVITYNTHSWGMGEGASGREQSDDGRHVLRYLAEAKADIVCLQESPFCSVNSGDVDTILAPAYHYRDTVRLPVSGAELTVLSRYPIVRKQLITSQDNGNGSAAFWLDIKGREVIVVNNHLQSTGLSLTDRADFSDMMHGRKDTHDSIKGISRNVFSKLLAATRLRVPQAKAIATFVRRHHHDGKGAPIIVCGDFNDIPQSFVHHTIADGLTDCYQSTATGPGYSFTHYGMRVRIDNILCTDDITPYNFRVDDSVPFSDHYPLRGFVTVAQ